MKSSHNNEVTLSPKVIFSKTLSAEIEELKLLYLKKKKNTDPCNNEVCKTLF